MSKPDDECNCRIPYFIGIAVGVAISIIAFW